MPQPPAAQTFRRPTAAAVVLCAALSGAATGATAQTVHTPGSGVLTMCSDWLLFNSCRTYHHIEVPARIAVGDRVRLDFGSNPKSYEFPVVRIVRDSGSCTLFDSAADDGNRIAIVQCHEVAPGAADQPPPAAAGKPVHASLP